VKYIVYSTQYHEISDKGSVSLSLAASAHSVSARKLGLGSSYF
jgi:hypothetical protein